MLASLLYAYDIPLTQNIKRLETPQKEQLPIQDKGLQRELQMKTDKEWNRISKIHEEGLQIDQLKAEYYALKSAKYITNKDGPLRISRFEEL